jgi:uncharacterized protein YegL
MSGQPIAELNRGLKMFFEEVIADDFARFSVEVAIITFGGCADVKLPFRSLANFKGEIGDLPELQASGDTPMGSAIRLGLGLLDKQKYEYRGHGVAYYQPWMILMTDGEPTDHEWQQEAQKAKELSEARKLVFLGIGVGSEVNMLRLADICPTNRPPKQLQGLRFAEFFEWLSQSMAQVSRSSVGDQTVKLPPTDGWAAI